MSGVLAGYLRRRVAIQTLALLLVLTALMQVLELLDVTTEILDRDLGIAGLFRYAMLRTPSELVVALPLAALLGAMSSLYAMARTQEMTAIRCAGLSMKRLFLILLPVAILLAITEFSLTQAVVPNSEAALKAWWDATAPTDNEPDPQWIRTSTGPVEFDGASADGRQLRKLRVYLRGDDGHFARRISARSAEWAGSGIWQMQDVEELHVQGASISRSNAAQLSWASNLRPDDVMRLDVDQPHLSGIILADLIAGERAGSQPRSYYQTVFIRSFTAPLAGIVMLLLALPSAATMTRRGGGGALLVALGLGLGFLLIDGICAALGTSGRLPAAMAALAAPVLFAGVGFLLLQYSDRT